MNTLWWMRGPLYAEAGVDTGGGGGGGGANGAAAAAAAAAAANGGEKSDYVTSKDFGATAAKVRGLEKQLKDMSASSLSQEKLFETLVTAGLVKKEEDGTYKPTFTAPEKKEEPGGAPPPPRDVKTDPEFLKLQREFEAIKRTTLEKDQQLAEEKAKAEMDRRTQAIVAGMAKANCVDPQLYGGLLTQKVKLNDKGEYVVAGKDKYDNDTEEKLDEFIPRWLTEHPEQLKVQINPGGGTPPGQRPAGRGGARIIPQSEWSNMEFMKTNRKKFDTGEWVRG